MLFINAKKCRKFELNFPYNFAKFETIRSKIYGVTRHKVRDIRPRYCQRSKIES